MRRALQLGRLFSLYKACDNEPHSILNIKVSCPREIRFDPEPPSPHTLRIVLRLQLPEPRKIDIEDIFCTFVAPSHIQLNTKRAILVMDVVRNLFDKSRSGRIRRRLSISDSGRQ